MCGPADEVWAARGTASTWPSCSQLTRANSSFCHQQSIWTAEQQRSAVTTVLPPVSPHQDDYKPVKSIFLTNFITCVPLPPFLTTALGFLLPFVRQVCRGTTQAPRPPLASIFPTQQCTNVVSSRTSPSRQGVFQTLLEHTTRLLLWLYLNTFCLKLQAKCMSQGEQREHELWNQVCSSEHKFISFIHSVHQKLV